MAPQRTRSKYWQGKRVVGQDHRSLRERVENWSRQEHARLRRPVASAAIADLPPILRVSLATENADAIAANLVEEMSDKTIREMVERRRLSNRPFAGVSTEALVRKLKKGVLTDDAQRLAAQEIASRSDKPLPK